MLLGPDRRAHWRQLVLFALISSPRQFNLLPTRGFDRVHLLDVIVLELNCEVKCLAGV